MKTLIFILVVMLSGGAWADDAAGKVVERVSCADLRAQIDELTLIENPDDETLDELDALNQEYRSQCNVVTRRGGPSSARMREMQTETVVTQEVETEPDAVEIAETETEQVAELTPEQVVANLDAGLCADGNTPNKFGCCGDEKFKDLGDGMFGCCPPDWETVGCFPPMREIL